MTFIIFLPNAFFLPFFRFYLLTLFHIQFKEFLRAWIMRELLFIVLFCLQYKESFQEPYFQHIICQMQAFLYLEESFCISIP